MELDKLQPNEAVLELGWLLKETNEVLLLLEKLRTQANNCLSRELSESQTASLFVEPILRGLGWHTDDIEQVPVPRQEGEIQLGDIHVLVAGKVVVLFEIKALRRPHQFDKMRHRMRHLFRNEDEHHVAQLWAEGNCFLGKDTPENVRKRCLRNGKPFLWGVLTNGAHWLIYDLAEVYGRLRVNLESHVEPIAEAEIFRSDPNLLSILRSISRSALSR